MLGGAENLRRIASSVILALLFLSLFAFTFNVQTAREQGGTIYINPNGSIFPSTASILNSGNVTYTLTGNINDSIVVERNNIVIDGAGYTVQGTRILSSRGVYLYGINNVTIRNMKIEAFDYGVDLYHSSSCTVSGNNITNNEVGVALDYPSNNTVSENNIANNVVGVFLLLSSNNTFYHNNFVGNTQQVSSNGSPNTWDNGYPSGGNYWSDYKGTDQKSGPYQNLTGGDGIGDTNYTINANNTDRYPLMGPSTRFM
jgi:parallel beta-helix repeat protein